MELILAKEFTFGMKAAEIAGGRTGWGKGGRYFAKGGYATRFWAIYLNGELLAVTVYRKGAIAIAQKLAG
jgi:hypothetical protein